MISLVQEVLLYYLGTLFIYDLYGAGGAEEVEVIFLRILLIYDLHVTGGDEKAEAGEGDGPGQAHHP
jgi:hypothetical protein